MFAIFLTEGMDPFYQNISSFPTVFFSLVLLVVTFYWLVAVLGFVDMEVLDFDFGDTDGSLDTNADSELSNPDVLAGLMLKLGLTGVPVTIIVSFIALFGWLVCYYAVHFLFGFIPSGILHFVAGIPVLLGALYVAAMITAVVIKPLRPLFQKAQQQTTQHVLGQTAIVRTLRVDAGFGEAVLEDGGAGLILKVRTAGEEKFEKGDRVVLLENIDESGVFRVVSEAEFRGG